MDIDFPRLSRAPNAVCVTAIKADTKYYCVYDNYREKDRGNKWPYYIVIITIGDEEVVTHIGSLRYEHALGRACSLARGVLEEAIKKGSSHG